MPGQQGLASMARHLAVWRFPSTSETSEDWLERCRGRCLASTWGVGCACGTKITELKSWRERERGSELSRIEVPSVQSVCGSLPSARNRSRQDIPSRRAVRRAVVPVCCRKSRGGWGLSSGQVTLQAFVGVLHGVTAQIQIRCKIAKVNTLI